MSVVASFEIECMGFLREDGTPWTPLPGWAEDADALLALYRAMARTRAFDQKAVELQRSGRLGTFASSLGQEAVSVGIGAAMADDDVLVPSFREHGTQLLRGVAPVELFRFWGGDERGNDFAVPREDFPISVPVGSHAPHATGVALAFRLRGEARAAVCVFGDGASSKGDVYEALNMAGAWRVPAVFVVTNNQWAISIARHRQTAAETLAQKAIAAGMPGLQVDGNDVVAVRHAVGEALDAARGGGGPRLIEAVTYRLADHTTADDASRYRGAAEVEAAWQREPMVRLRRHLSDAGRWSKEDEETLKAAMRDEMNRAAEEYLADAPQNAAAMFDHLFAALPADTARQRAVLAGEEADADG